VTLLLESLALLFNNANLSLTDNVLSLESLMLSLQSTCCS
jgi:hypothetical protein